MTESIADRYRRRAEAFADTIDAVPTDRWDAPSPCEDWTALDVVRHVCDTQGLFAGFVGREPAPHPDPADDPAAAWAAARAGTQDALDDPEQAAQEFDGMLGRQRFDAAVDRFLSLDLVVHRWDVGRAADVPVEVPAEDVAAMVRAVEEMAATVGDAMRGPQGFGPALDPPADADDLTRVLAFLGRRAW